MKMSSSLASTRNNRSIFEAKRYIWPTVWNSCPPKPSVSSSWCRSPSTVANHPSFGDGTHDLTHSPTSSESSLLSTVSQSSCLTLDSDHVKQIFEQNLVPNMVLRAEADAGDEPLVPASSCAKGGCAAVEVGSSGQSIHTDSGFESACASAYEYGYLSEAYYAPDVVVPCNACAEAGPFLDGRDYTPLSTYHNEAEVEDAYLKAHADTNIMHSINSIPHAQPPPRPVSSLNPKAAAFIPRIAINPFSSIPQNVNASQRANQQTTARIGDYDQCDDYCHYVAVDAAVASLHRPFANVDADAEPKLKLNLAAGLTPSIVVSPPSLTTQEVEGSSLGAGEIRKETTSVNGATTSLDSSGLSSSSGERKHMLGRPRKKAEMRRNKIKIAMGSGWQRM